MKNLFLIGLAFTLAACVDDLESAIEAFEDELDVSITLNSTYDDKCLENQMLKLYSEYDELEDTEQDYFKAQFEGIFDTIVLEPTEVGQTIEGGFTDLRYGQRVCSNGSCYFRGIATKVLSDQRTFAGMPAETKLSRLGMALNLKAEYDVDRSVHRRYQTYYVSTFDEVEDLGRSFSDALAAGRVWLAVENGRVGFPCGDYVSLEDLVRI